MGASSLSELEYINFQDLLNEVPKDWTCHVNLPYRWLFQWEILIFPKIKKKEKEERKSGNAWEKKINESYFLSPFKLSKILLINNSVFLIWQQDVSFLFFFQE